MRRIGKAILCLGLSVFAGDCLVRADQSDSLKQAELIPPSVEARLDSSMKESLQEALADAGDNASQLIRALEHLQGSLFKDGLFLIQNMPHLDRLEMTADILLHQVIYADSSRRVFPWSVPDSLYRQFILTYRLDQEPVTDWRFALWSWVRQQARHAASSEDFARKLNRWITENLREQKGEFFGGQQAPDQTFAVQRGTKQEIASLTTALLKTAGIPSRRISVDALLLQTGGASWTEVYCVEKASWLPLYPDASEHFGDFSYREPDSLKSNIPYALASSAFENLDVTPAYTQTGNLEISFARGGSPAAGFDGFTINVFNAGAFSAIDALESVADSSGIYRCRLGEGRYWVICGVRDLTGSPFVRLLPTDILPGETTRASVDLTPETYVALPQSRNQEAAPVPLFAISDARGNVRSSREAVGKSPLLIVLLYPNHEPSARTADLIRPWLSKNGTAAPRSLWVTEGSRDESQPAEVAFDPEGSLGKLFGLQSSNDYPLLVWVDKNGLITLTSRGYNLNIEALLEEGLKK